MKSTIALCMSLLIGFVVKPCYGTEDHCPQVHVPDAIQSAINKRFPGWQIVRVRNLRSDDQKLWLQAHAGECPGIAQGHFEGGTITSYAMTLFRSSPKVQQVLLVVSPDHSGKPRIHILSQPQSVAYLSVVYKTPPGSYSAVEGGTIKVRNEAISYEAIEAGIVAYYFAKGTYRTVQTSE